MPQPNQWPNPGYRWEEWFSRPKFSLVRDKHFHCQPHSMAVMVRQQAAKHGIRVSVRILEDVVVVKVLGAIV
jgi:hypothetical protein